MMKKNIWIICLFVISGVVLAKPSIQQRVYVVSQNNPYATDTGPGSEKIPFKTISAAAAKAGPGDTVLVHTGTYRERIVPAKGGTSKYPIVYMAAKNEKVIVKGSEIFKSKWEKIKGFPGVFQAKLDAAMFKGIQNPYNTTISISNSDRSDNARPSSDEKKMPRTLGQIFLDGSPLIQLENVSDVYTHSGTWVVSPAGDKIILHVPDLEKDISEYLVEISVRDRIFAPDRRGLCYIHVKGFIFEHCANQGPFPQGGAVSPRSGRSWVIENNTIRFAKTIGLDCGSETWNLSKLHNTAKRDRKRMTGGGHLIRNNIISDNGLCGVAGWKSPNVKIVGNLLERNNRLGFGKTDMGVGWEEWAAIKLHDTNAVIEGNIIRDNDAHGVWLDNGYKMSRITRNLIVNNLQSGVFLELGSGSSLIDNNIIAFTRSQGGYYNGNGIFAHDASDLKIAHNLFLANAGSGVCMRIVTKRKFAGKTVQASREEIINNIFVDNARGAIDLPYTNPRSHDNTSDYNVFLTSEHERVRRPRFSLNHYRCDFSWDVVAARLIDGLKKAGVPQEKLPNMQVWRAHPVLTLKQWQILMGMDKHSVMKKPKRMQAVCRSRSGTLTFEFPELLWDIKCPVVEDVDKDYLGKPMPKVGNIIPGPFQNIKPGRNTMVVTPLYFEPKLRLNPIQKERLKSEKNILDALKTVPKNTKQEVISVDNLMLNGKIDNKSNAWISAVQEQKNPELFDSYLKLAPCKDALMHAKSTAGPSLSPSKVLFYKIPSDGWYKITFAGELLRRSSASAGHVTLSFYQISADMKDARLLNKIKINAEGGYGKFPDSFLWSDTLPFKGGMLMGLRMQVKAPGPAPAGDAVLQITQAKAERFK